MEPPRRNVAAVAVGGAVAALNLAVFALLFASLFGLVLLSLTGEV